MAGSVRSRSKIENARTGTDLQGTRWPTILYLGLAAILIIEALLFTDLWLRGGAIVPGDPLAEPVGLLGEIARWTAVNMAALCWVAYLVTLDGLLALIAARRGRNGASDGSPIRKRPRRFVLCFLVSVPIWLFFDWINFSFIHAWDYHGLAENLVARWTGYFFAFGAICPAMFLTAEVIRQLGLDPKRGAVLIIPGWLEIGFVALGLALLALPFALRDPLGNFGLWLALCFLLDPINRRLGAPSLIADWAAGRWGRTLSLMAAGFACGLLWEFWNYWAVAKWTYSLPFLGALEEIRYFEMPVLGLTGFLPFALECWIMFQTALLILEKAGLRLAEPLPRGSDLL